MIDFIRTGAGRMRRLLEDLLAYAQASHFESRQDEKTSLAKALRTVLENLRADIEATHATIDAGPLPDVAISETHAVQLLQNLIGNSLNYRSDAPPDIRISCERKGADWLVRVSDNGIGIEARYLGEIFKPFRRLHGGERPGSGIGLSTCQKVVAGYGGQIWAESEPGRGSTFFLTLPEVAKDSLAVGQQAGSSAG